MKNKQTSKICHRGGIFLPLLLVVAGVAASTFVVERSGILGKFNAQGQGAAAVLGLPYTTPALVAPSLPQTSGTLKTSSSQAPSVKTSFPSGSSISPSLLSNLTSSIHDLATAISASGLSDRQKLIDLEKKVGSLTVVSAGSASGYVHTLVLPSLANDPPRQAVTLGVGGDNGVFNHNVSAESATISGDATAGSLTAAGVTVTGSTSLSSASITTLTVSGNTSFPGSGIWNSVGNVGVGTSTPYSRFSVWGSDALSGTRMFELTNNASTTLAAMQNDGTFYLNGSVGVGTTVPSYLFGVSGGTGIVAEFSGRVIGGEAVYGNEFATLRQVAAGTQQYWASSTTDLSPLVGGDDVYLPTGSVLGIGYDPLSMGASAVAAFDGNVGIGSSSPNYKLDVAGFINVNEYSGYKQNGNTILYASSTTHNVAIGASSSAAWMGCRFRRWNEHFNSDR